MHTNIVALPFKLFKIATTKLKVCLSKGFMYFSNWKQLHNKMILFYKWAQPKIVTMALRAIIPLLYAGFRAYKCPLKQLSIIIWFIKYPLPGPLWHPAITLPQLKHPTSLIDLPWKTPPYKSTTHPTQKSWWRRLNGKVVATKGVFRWNESILSV